MELSLRDLKELMSQGSSKSHPYKIGTNYLIRTVTAYWVGKLTEVFEHEMLLSQASWIAHTGRYHDCFKNGFDEIEPVNGPTIVGRGSIVDCVEWTLELPTEQK